MAGDRKILAYGSWPSPIGADYVTAGSIARNHPCKVGEHCYWQETRPDEQGRTTVVVLYPDGTKRDLLPCPVSCQSKVHEYGGRAWLIAGNELLFVDKTDQRIYRAQLPADPGDETNFEASAISPEDSSLRFADFCHDRSRQRLIAVCEDHSGPGEPANYLAAVPLDGSCEIHRLVEGADFFAYPEVSPDGRALSWLSWDHPNMPWDGTLLRCGKFASNGDLSAMDNIAGGASESVFQPAWSPEGVLHYVSDASGWWNLYRHTAAGNGALYPCEAEFATPLWALGMTTYDFLPEGRVAALYTAGGSWGLGVLNPESGQFSPLDTPFTEMAALSVSGDDILFIGSSEVTANEVVVTNATGDYRTLAGGPPDLDAGYISRPRFVTFASGGNDEAFGLYYPPANRDYAGPDGEAPPLIVVCHGGPTGANYRVLNFKIQYWTSRGFAVLDVNYRGSTGFGRAYREKLRYKWGLVDVEDAVAGANHLIDRGLADPARTIIRGSSAGGYTVLAALTFADTFAAGASLYGIGDLEALARDTHKFESRYMDSLVGPYPEMKNIYRARSPIAHTEKLNCPVIFFQGMEDKVVPPNQAKSMTEALRGKNIPVAYVTFADEGHGFRKAENIKTALESELAFYRKVLLIPTQEAMREVVIDNFFRGRPT